MAVTSRIEPNKATDFFRALIMTGKPNKQKGENPREMVTSDPLLVIVNNVLFKHNQEDSFIVFTMNVSAQQ